MSSPLPSADDGIPDDDWNIEVVASAGTVAEQTAEWAAGNLPPKTSRRRPRHTESEVTKLALSWLRAQPRTYAWKLHTGAYGESGHPDIDGCVDGRSLKIEMKEPGYKPTTLQRARLITWRKTGALVGWATSLEEVQQIFAHAPDRDWVNPLTGPGDGSPRKPRG